ncbi:MAG: DNA mismatch repair protein MutS, partial [Mariprofundaceae bacterium]|nr:DNA mismatch repair protein MutS [Mariprofundaceae bacterium]
TLTKRGKANGADIPMAGVPWHQSEQYLPRLVAAGVRVAICEQMEAPGGKGPVRREVVRVVTPGTITEAELLDESRVRPLVALCGTPAHWALAAVDLSSGVFRLLQGQGAAALDEELAVLAASELLLADAHAFDGLGNKAPTHYPGDWCFTVEVAEERIARCFGIGEMASLNLHKAPLAAAAVGAVLVYLEQTQKRSLDHLQLPVLREAQGCLGIDARSRRNLELYESLSGDPCGGMIGVIDRTLTPMGARMLRDWLDRPLNEAAGISARQDAVQSLIDDADALYAIGEGLKNIRDVERMLTRLALERAAPRDYRGLANSLLALPGLVTALDGRSGLFVEIIAALGGLD